MNPTPIQRIDLPLLSIVRVVLVLAASAFLITIRDIIGILFFALIIASASDPLATWFEKRGIPRLLAVLLLFLSAGSIIGFIFYLILPPLFLDMRELAVNFPTYAEKIIQNLESFSFVPQGLLAQYLGRFIADISTDVGGSAAAGVPKVLGNILGGTVSIVSIFLISFYLSLRRDGVERFLRLLTPQQQEPYIVDLWERAQHKLGQWFRGQVILLFLVGALTFAGLSVFGVRYSLLLAVVAAFLEIVPIVGPIAAGVIAVGVALTQSLLLAVVVAALYLLIQQIESNVIVPLVFRKVLGLHPVVVILSLLIGARLAGIPGMMLAVPVAAVLTEFFSDVAKGKVKL